MPPTTVLLTMIESSVSAQRMPWKWSVSTDVVVDADVGFRSVPEGAQHWVGPCMLIGYSSE